MNLSKLLLSFFGVEVLVHVLTFSYNISTVDTAKFCISNSLFYTQQKQKPKMKKVEFQMKTHLPRFDQMTKHNNYLVSLSA